MYCHIQLLCSLCNEIQQQMMLVPFLFTATLINAFSLATLVHIHFSQNKIVSCVLMSAFINMTLVILFVFGGMASVNRKSKQFIQSLTSHHNIARNEMERLWTRKFAKACQPMKVKFGTNNFIEALTPLKCLSCAARLTIQILLCERRHGR